jgi:hypothetical protein
MIDVTGKPSDSFPISPASLRGMDISSNLESPLMSLYNLVTGNIGFILNYQIVCCV